ncbi:MAG TPA: sigma-70 family RNA polymerase sigma factor [Anaerolineae bacterium]|nr:sigma-70 family RNA polymerase sigma factor [Anaerolineae bacterium]
MSPEQEQALITAAKTDPEAFGQLYDHFIDAIYNYIYYQTKDHIAAQDITATTFEKALNALPNYTWTGKPLGAWLYRIAHNEIVNHWRRQKKAPLPLSPWWGQASGVETAVETHETLAAIKTAMNHLSPQDQEILALRYWDDLSTEELAAALDCQPNTIYVRVHRALNRLKKIMS